MYFFSCLLRNTSKLIWETPRSRKRACPLKITYFIETLQKRGWNKPRCSGIKRCVHACVCVCMHVCVTVCVCVFVCVRAVSLCCCQCFIVFVYFCRIFLCDARWILSTAANVVLHKHLNTHSGKKYITQIATMVSDCGAKRTGRLATSWMCIMIMLIISPAFAR